MSKKKPGTKEEATVAHGICLSTKKYEAELVKLQYWVQKKELRIIVVFEGREAVRKGDVIKRLTERVSPRFFQVAALPATTECERTQCYPQRYILRYPAAGELVLFNRNWYNRAAVEWECKDFLKYSPIFKRSMSDSGILLNKYRFDFSMEEQLRRFQKRLEDRRNPCKLSPMDVQSFKRYYDYSWARQEMLAATHKDYAPWYLVQADDKKHTRLNCLSHFLSLVPGQAAATRQGQAWQATKAH